MNANSFLVRFLYICILFLGCGLGSAQLTRRAPIPDVLVPSEYGETVFLSIDDMYLLYVHPVTPFVTDEGVIMVPLNGINELLRFTVSVYEERDGTMVAGATQFRSSPEENRGITFREGSREAEVSIFGQFQFRGHPLYVMKLGAAPIYVEETYDMLVPLQALVDVFNLDVRLEPELRVAHLRSPHVTNLYADLGSEFMSEGNTRAFVPEHVAFQKRDEPTEDGGALWDFTLTIQGFPSVMDTDGPTMVWMYGTFSGNDFYSAPHFRTGTSAYKCPKENGRFVCRQQFDELSLWDLRYLLVRLARTD
jgi:hypothetical protein